MRVASLQTSASVLITERRTFDPKALRVYWAIWCADSRLKDASKPGFVKGMTAEQQRPGHKHKNSLLASPFEQVANSESTQTLEGESVALISPAAQSSQRPSMRRMSGKALFAE